MPSRRARGISPIVAAILLILVAIAGAVIVYLWLTGFAGTATATPASMKARITIENVNLTTDNVTLYVRNVGDTTINVSNAAIYIYDHWSGALVTAVTSTGNNCGDMLKPGAICEIYATSSLSGITAGKYYDIKLSVAGIEAYYSGVQAS
ncbi:MAG: hypothetical protein GXO09_00415 [Crenarchaeota archaeon]|nr:hypothetical protein [Thermoproteota archaeon]